jgi:hypothetical protein
MKRFLQWIALAAMVCSLNSCSLPGILGRTMGNLTKSLGGLAGPAAAAAAL